MTTPLTTTSSGQKTVNIDGNFDGTLLSVNENYQAVVGIVAALMALSAQESQQQAALAQEFNAIENGSTPPSSGTPNPYHWSNNLYELKKPGATSDDISRYSALYSSDNSSYNSANQEMSGFITQINQITSQNTQGESTTTAVGTSLTNFMNSFTRLITF